MDEPSYDLLLRDPEGTTLDRWIIDARGRPCLGNRVVTPPSALWDLIAQTVEEDRRARKESA